MSDLVLEVNGIGKRYGGFELSDLSFTIPRGAVMGLIGPNGAGKTTTLRIIMGLTRAEKGTVRIFGQDARSVGAKLREKIGFVYDDGRFYGSLTVAENAAWLGSVYRAWDKQRFESLIAEFGIGRDKKTDDLSRGQKTKFSLAVALSHGAELLVLDEPTSGLDPTSRSEVLDLLYRYIGQGEGSVLFSTHITSDLERIADYVTFLRSGRLVWTDETAEVVGRHGIVKGGVGDYEAVKPLLIGARVAETGFEGLSDRLAELGTVAHKQEGRLVLDKASLDDIVVYSTREDYRVRVDA